MINKLIWAVIGLASLFAVAWVTIFAVITFGFYTWSVVGIIAALALFGAGIFMPNTRKGHHA
jgi:uncharacterized membrane protein